jgi:hypothetical protein
VTVLRQEAGPGIGIPAGAAGTVGGAIADLVVADIGIRRITGLGVAAVQYKKFHGFISFPRNNIIVRKLR